MLGGAPLPSRHARRGALSLASCDSHPPPAPFSVPTPTGRDHPGVSVPSRSPLARPVATTRLYVIVALTSGLHVTVPDETNVAGSAPATAFIANALAVGLLVVTDIPIGMNALHATVG